MKLLFLAMVLMLSTAAFANKFVEVKLNANILGQVVDLANRYKPKFTVNGPCTQAEFAVAVAIDGIEGTTYLVKSQAGISKVHGADAEAVKTILESAKVPGNRTGYTTFVKELVIRERGCGRAPSVWTGTYEIFGPDWK